jgi:GTP cyclohydrolase FolE2
MDSKITLSFNTDVIAQAKAFANQKGISLSRLTEYLYSKMTAVNDANIYDLPINSWVLDLAEGKPSYQHKPKSRKENRSAYYGKFETNSDNIAAEAEGSYKTKKKK